MSIIPTNVNYNYSLLKQNLRTLENTYPFINIQSVGKVFSKKIFMLLNSGTGLKEVFYSGSIHANEWITSLLLMKFIENYCISYNNNSKLYGYSVRELFNNVSIYIMPMVNPDGVDLVTGNISKTSSAFLTARNISNNFSDIPFPSRLES